MAKNFVFYADWKTFIDKLSSQADKLYLLTAIVDYGTTGEYDLKNADPIVENLFESLVKPAIDRSQKNYSESVEYGKTHGRPKAVSEDQIIGCIKAGLRAREIAKELGISEASVYHSDAWKNRKNL